MCAQITSVFHFACFSVCVLQYFFMNESIVCVHTTSIFVSLLFLPLLLSSFSVFNFLCMLLLSVTLYLYKRLQWQ